jgi:LPXTG-motif cell wall-anchored protein
VLEPGESVTFTAVGTATLGEYHNVAVVTAETSDGKNVSDEDESWYTGTELDSTGTEKPKPGGGGLPVTGGQMLLTALGGLGLLIAGAALWLMRRRRA